MKIDFFWEDRHWKQRGCANNVWLTIYPDEKEYRKTITPYCDTCMPNVIEVKRKLDIEEMISYLKGKGYREEGKT